MDRQSVNSQITELIGQETAPVWDAFFSDCYPVLKKMARNELNRFYNDDHVTATVLVNECYLKLRGRRNGKKLSRKHFFRLAARSMRFYLIDLIRRGQCDKRKARETLLHASRISGESCLLADMLDLDRAMNWLHRIKPELVELVELRLFLGLTLREIADMKKLNVSKVHRQWTLARAMLSEYLDCDQEPSD